MSEQYIDISVSLDPSMPIWPGGYGIHTSPLNSIQKGDVNNVTRLDMDIHCGTHIDAPRHFIDGGAPTAAIPVEKGVGHCYVGGLRGVREIGPEDLSRLSLPKDTKRLLLLTDNSLLWKNTSHQFDQSFSALTNEGAQWVVEHGIELIGIDYLSIQLYEDPPDTHLTLLNNNVLILEGLNLLNVEPGEYELICLPVKINETDGAPARAVLKPLH